MSNCLFCASHCPSKFVIVDGHVRKLKAENDSSLLPSGNESSCETDKTESEQNSFRFPGDSMITEQLKVIFILRTILKLGEEQLCEFLGSSGQLHPEYWISVCSSCTQTVQKFYVTLKEIGRLERRLLNFSNQLISEIHRSKSEEGSGPTEVLWKTIRNQVLKDSTNSVLGKDSKIEAGQNPIIVSTKSLVADLVLEHPDEDKEEESGSEWEPDDLSPHTDNNEQKCMMSNSHIEDDKDDNCTPRSATTNGSNIRRGKRRGRNVMTRSLGKRFEGEQPTVRRKKLLNKSITRFAETGNPNYTAFYRGPTKHYACVKCPATDTYPILMEAHLKLHEEGSGAIPCPECGWFVLPHRMNYHYGKRHPLPDGTRRSGKKGKIYKEKRYHFKCPDCSALLTSVGKYREHEELHRSGGGQVCAKCGWLCKRMSNHKAYWHDPNPNRKIPQREIKFMKRRGENEYVRRKNVHPLKLEGNRSEESHSSCSFNDSLAKMNAEWIAGIEEEHSNFSSSAATLRSTSLVSEHHSSLFLDSDDEWIGQEKADGDPQAHTDADVDALRKSRSNSSKIVIHSLDTSHPKYTKYYKGTTRYYGCRECPAEDCYLKLLEAHMKLHEQGSGAIPCPQCGWLVMPEKLSFHRGKHHKPAHLPKKPPHNLFYFKCPDCKALLCSIGKYREHEEMHENGKGKTCTICGWLVKELGRHCVRWHPKDPKSAKEKVMHPRKIKLMKKRTSKK